MDGPFCKNINVNLSSLKQKNVTCNLGAKFCSLSELVQFASRQQKIGKEHKKKDGVHDK